MFSVVGIDVIACHVRFNLSEDLKDDVHLDCNNQVFVIVVYFLGWIWYELKCRY
jgi:hypothetical protein